MLLPLGLQLQGLLNTIKVCFSLSFFWAPGVAGWQGRCLSYMYTIYHQEYRSF